VAHQPLNEILTILMQSVKEFDLLMKQIRLTIGEALFLTLEKHQSQQIPVRSMIRLFEDLWELGMDSMKKGKYIDILETMQAPRILVELYALKTYQTMFVEN
jgi:hypothetical protein